MARSSNTQLLKCGIAASVALICCSPTHGLTVRQDVVDGVPESRADAQWAAAVGALFADRTYPQRSIRAWERQFGTPWPLPTEDVFGGSGTLIAPNVVLTAAHLFDQQGSTIDEGSAYWRFMNSSGEDIVDPARVSHWVEHPGFGDVFDGQNNAGYDIALVFLEEEVQGINPINIYRDNNERGRIGQIVGYGEYRRNDGTIARTEELPQKRRGDNRIDLVDPHLSPYGVWQGYHHNVMLADYDDPSLYAAGIRNNDPEAAWPVNPLGSTAPTTYESMLGSGDSGGGLFTWNPSDQEFQIMGVNSFILNFSDPNGFNHYDYDEISGFARVSTVADWIDLTISQNIPAPGALPVAMVLALGCSHRRRATQT